MQVANKLLIHRWFEEVWNKKRGDLIPDLLHPHAVIHGLAPAGTVLKGPDAFRPFFESFISAFPDIKVAVESTLAEDDKVAARCSVRGTHKGPGLGIAPTGKKVNMTGMVLVQVVDGKLYEGWNCFDFLTLYQQIGVLPQLK